jgi:hypothetical protein
MKKTRLIIALTMATLLFSTQNAYAYLDPGTGSILLQGLIGGIAGGLFAARLYWGKLKSYFGRSGSPADQPIQGPDQDQGRR